MPKQLSDDEKAILAEFVEETEQALGEITSQLENISPQEITPEFINIIFRPIHSVKGNSAFLGLLNTRKLSHEMESLLDDMRKGKVPPTKEAIAAFMDGVKLLHSMMLAIRSYGDELENVTSFGQVLITLNKARGRAPQEQKATITERAPQPLKKEAPATQKSADVAAQKPLLPRMLRLPENSIKEIADLFNQVYQSIYESKSSNTTIEQTTLGLLETINQKIKLLFAAPLKELFNRAPLIARETAERLGKRVELRITGDDIIVPRALIEIMEAPLMHIIRNSIDHGIEVPALRKQRGKPEAGTIKIEATIEQNMLKITISDDGAGIDFKALLTKAIQMGIKPKQGQWTPEEIKNLIFVSGLSSAKQITDVSGRGVGMDVVKHNVEKAGGKILVYSRPTAGTDVIIKLPLEE